MNGLGKKRQTASRHTISTFPVANKQRAASIGRKMMITRLTLAKTGKSQ